MTSFARVPCRWVPYFWSNELERALNLRRKTLEALVLKCPTEVAPSMVEIIDLATTLVKYDPVRFLLILLRLAIK